jgi:hypothetical protein
MSLLLIYWLLSLLTIAVCAFAVWKGGPAERWGAAVILGLVVAERLCRLIAPSDLQPILSLAGDALTALGLLVLAVRFTSLWLGGAMLFYASTFVLHSVYLVSGRSEADPLHYWLNNVNFAGIHICLVVGTLIGWRRRVKRQQTAAPATMATAAS